MNSTTITQTLDWNQRLPEIKESIDEKYEKLCTQKESGWLFNGSKEYNICKINEHKWFVALIKKTYPARKAYTAIDLGAGDFTWGKAIAATINDPQNQLPRDITVHIISVRGEPNSEEEYIEDGNCRLMNFGAIKIENLFEALAKKHFYRNDLENNVDLIISRFTLCHLTDSAGLIPQCLHMMGETSLFVFDGFYFLYENQMANDIHKNKAMDSNRNLIKFLVDSKLPFIMQNLATKCSSLFTFNHFAIKKGKNPIHIPLQYKGIQIVEDVFNSQIMVQFTGNYTEDNNIKMPNASEESLSLVNYYGNEDLFEELKPYLNCEQPLFHPIIRGEKLEGNSLFKAVLNNDIEFLKNNPLDIDSLEFNPLSLCIELQHKEMFDLLLQHNPRLASMSEKDGNAPIHIAALYDNNGYYIEALIAACADFNKQNKQGHTPLVRSILCSNNRAKEILKNNNANYL